MEDEENFFDFWGEEPISRTVPDVEKPAVPIRNIGDKFTDKMHNHWEVVGLESGIVWMTKNGGVIPHPIVERYFSLYYIKEG